MLEELKEQVLSANLDLPRYGLVTFTWGNVSGIDRDRGLIVIKPSGVPYHELRREHLVVLNLNGKQVEGSLHPSSDALTHLLLYQCFKDIGGIVHTHSPWATAWAQAGKGIPPMGTTHADYFFGEIPCTRSLSTEEVNGDYEVETGRVIVERFHGMDPMQIPAVLVKNHGPFCWGKDSTEAVHNAVVLEEVAKIAHYTSSLPSADTMPIDRSLLEKHFMRKHGPNATYGQESTRTAERIEG